MATVFVYNNYTGNIERYIRGENDAMPYNVGRTLRVGEFRGSSCSPVLWTTRAAMEAWNVTRAAYGRPIFVGYAFRRIWEGGHSTQSQHYAGTAFDVGHTLTASERAYLRQVALNTGVWSYVEPLAFTPRWLHFDKRIGPPACTAGGFPTVRRGSRNNYVFILQDALNALNFGAGALDGVFGPRTQSAVISYQRSRGLAADGIVGCQTWTALVREAAGIGRTRGVVDGC